MRLNCTDVGGWRGWLIWIRTSPFVVQGRALNVSSSLQFLSIDEIVGIEPQPLIIRRKIFHKSGNRHRAIDRIFGVPRPGFRVFSRPEEIHLASQVGPLNALFGG